MLAWGQWGTLLDVDRSKVIVSQHMCKIEDMNEKQVALQVMALSALVTHALYYLG
jgi:hypothetical protein